jgi:hypothetical protein
MIKVETRILFTSPDLESRGWKDPINLPFMPLNFHGLPEDGVIYDDAYEEIIFLTHDEGEFYVFDDDDEFIKFMPSDAGQTSLTNFSNEMTTANYKVFTVGKHEHGNVIYTLHNPQHQSDASSWDYGFGGYLAVSRDVPNMEDAAAGYLKTYTDYVNGEVYNIVCVPLNSPDEWNSCGGFIGLDHAIECIKNKDF